MDYVSMYVSMYLHYNTRENKIPVSEKGLEVFYLWKLCKIQTENTEMETQKPHFL